MCDTPQGLSEAGRGGDAHPDTDAIRHPRPVARAHPRPRPREPGPRAVGRQWTRTQRSPQWAGGNAWPPRASTSQSPAPGRWLWVYPGGSAGPAHPHPDEDDRRMGGGVGPQAQGGSAVVTAPSTAARRRGAPGPPHQQCGRALPRPPCDRHGHCPFPHLRGFNIRFLSFPFPNAPPRRPSWQRAAAWPRSPRSRCRRGYRATVGSPRAPGR